MSEFYKNELAELQTIAEALSVRSIASDATLKGFQISRLIEQQARLLDQVEALRLRFEDASNELAHRQVQDLLDFDAPLGSVAVPWLT